jgi:hypothetical protein
MDKTFTLTIEAKNTIYTVDNLTMNGNNYVSDSEINTSGWPSVFKLTAKDGEGNVTETIENAKLVQQHTSWIDNKYYLAFAPVSDQEVKNAEFQANLEYLAMMADVNIDE